MTILDRYIFRQVLLASLGAVGVFAFVLLVGNVVKDLLGAVAAEQISVETFFMLVALLVPGVVSYALPMGILTGVLLVLGRLSASQEITAMRGAGRGLPRIAVPILVLAFAGAGLSLWFNTALAPRSMNRYRQALADAVRVNPLSFIVPREFVRNFPGYAIYVGAKRGAQLENAWIWVLDKQGRTVQVAHGQRGECQFDEAAAALDIRLQPASVEIRPHDNPEVPQAEGSVAPFVTGGSGRFLLPLEKLFGPNTYRQKITLKSYAELAEDLRTLDLNPEHRPAAEVARSRMAIRFTMQRQFVLAAAVLAFALMGVPLGIKMQRKESSANLGLALVLALGFYFVLIMIDWLQQQPQWRPDLLLWLPNLLYAGLGVWLFWRVDRQ